MAKESIGNNYFGVMLPDDLIVGAQPGLKQLIEVAQKHNGSVIAVKEVPKERVSSYGVVAIKETVAPDVFEVSHVVEKPQPEDAPSNLAIIGRYVLAPQIFDSLENIKPGSGGEIQLTDGIEHMIKHHGQKVYAYKIKGTRYDTGQPHGWLSAVLDIALQDPKYVPYVKEVLAKHNIC